MPSPNINKQQLNASIKVQPEYRKQTDDRISGKGMQQQKITGQRKLININNDIHKKSKQSHKFKRKKKGFQKGKKERQKANQCNLRQGSDSLHQKNFLMTGSFTTSVTSNASRERYRPPRCTNNLNKQWSTMVGTKKKTVDKHLQHIIAQHMNSVPKLQ